jgi:acyl-CoA thioesterase
MGDLEHDTRLEGADGHYRTTLSRDWEIWGPNGGYMAVVALRAAGAEAAIPRPASFAAHLLAVGRFDAVDVSVVVVRRGKRSESLRVAVTQEGRPLLEALVRTAADGPGLEHRFGRAPHAPQPETLQSMDELRDPEWPVYPFWQNLDAGRSLLLIDTMSWPAACSLPAAPSSTASLLRPARPLTQEGRRGLHPSGLPEQFSPF